MLIHFKLIYLKKKSEKNRTPFNGPAIALFL